MAAPGYFPPALATPRDCRVGTPTAGLCIAKQNSRASPSSAGAPALRFAPGAGPFRPPSGDRHEGRDGRGRSGQRASTHDDRPRRHRIRTAAQLIPNRSRPQRASALRLPPLPRRARSEAASRRRRRRRRPRRHLRRPGLDSSATRGSSPTSRTCSGRPSISSTAPSTASSANSTTTSRLSCAARRSRMAPRYGPSNSSASRPRASH